MDEGGGGMDIVFHDRIYREDISDRKMASIQKKIQKRSPKLNLFLVTLPIGNQGILEIYWYPELLQPFYQRRKQKIVVVGVAMSREGAYELVEKIIKDVGFQDGVIPVTEFFEEKT